MEYIRDNLEYKTDVPTAITLGKFDGLHRGHELLMKTLFAEGKKRACKTVVFTFDIPPRRQVYETEARVLTTNEEKRLIFEKTGVDYLFECPFTPEIMRMEPEAFIRWLVEAFCARVIVVGRDFHFGHNRAGDYHVLMEYADHFGYEVVVVEKMQEDGRDISSTFVREELLAGRIARANQLLGYHFFVQSTVVHGNHFGRTIGIPTINMEFPPEKLLPPNGVYVSAVHVGEETLMGVTNVGCKPTVADSGKIGVETHIIGMGENLYDRCLTVDFLQFIRPEKKFASVETLRAQMEQDIAYTIKYYKNITKNG
ncbi:MAG: bifunctional riboflavin kinase/FAD synthetase [Muribaculaceae bacterium]|nr:bifunctional riboflavin kinase/FAD synthetase [Roseburia sp.]MCM1431001.1 bifunctional riboflavin kinase/FAD synthetase [Muribaculaceae bacterium]MCM1493765.1 bifunctional riboflavin kinase/FAD synthetase [Muribaculaceae bacterium]